MSEVVIRDYYVSPEDIERSRMWLESMSDVLRIDENNKVWVRIDDLWCTPDIDKDDR